MSSLLRDYTLKVILLQQSSLQEFKKKSKQSCLRSIEELCAGPCLRTEINQSHWWIPRHKMRKAKYAGLRKEFTQSRPISGYN